MFGGVVVVDETVHAGVGVVAATALQGAATTQVARATASADTPMNSTFERRTIPRPCSPRRTGWSALTRVIPLETPWLP